MTGCHDEQNHGAETRELEAHELRPSPVGPTPARADARRAVQPAQHIHWNAKDLCEEKGTLQVNHHFASHLNSYKSIDGRYSYEIFSETHFPDSIICIVCPISLNSDFSFQEQEITFFKS